MKRIAFTDFWDGFCPEEFIADMGIADICDVEVTDLEHADYVIYSLHGNKHWKSADRQIKIFYTVENLVPDFNACDYGIGFEWMDYGDRYLRMPLYYNYRDINELAEKTKRESAVTGEESGKRRFCSITVSNANRAPIFAQLFEALSRYKSVDSGGKWRNNTGGPVKDKMAFDREHKFSIVCENSAHPGYTTEKIVQAFAAGCIPIYWGDPEIARVFNAKAFIHVRDYGSINEVVRAVQRIDGNDELYRAMLAEPILADPQYGRERQLEKLKQFFAHIFEQPLEQAQRRNRVFHGKIYLEQRRRQVSGLSFVLSRWYHDFVWKIKEYKRSKLSFRIFV